jgi:hypothetical protein
MKPTYRIIEGKTRQVVVEDTLRALRLISGRTQGTAKKPANLAASNMPDGRTLIQTVAEDGYVQYTDGYYLIKVDDHCLIADFAAKAMTGQPAEEQPARG